MLLHGRLIRPSRAENMNLCHYEVSGIKLWANSYERAFCVVDSTFIVLLTGSDTH